MDLLPGASARVPADRNLVGDQCQAGGDPEETGGDADCRLAGWSDNRPAPPPSSPRYRVVTTSSERELTMAPNGRVAAIDEPADHDSWAGRVESLVLVGRCHRRRRGPGITGRLAAPLAQSPLHLGPTACRVYRRGRDRAFDLGRAVAGTPTVQSRGLLVDSGQPSGG